MALDNAGRRLDSGLDRVCFEDLVCQSAPPCLNGRILSLFRLVCRPSPAPPTGKGAAQACFNNAYRRRTRLHLWRDRLCYQDLQFCAQTFRFSRNVSYLRGLGHRFTLFNDLPVYNLERGGIALAAIWGTLLMVISVVLRIGIPVYLYQQAKQRRFALPWLWVLFGIFEPVVALMLYYAAVHLLRKPVHKGGNGNALGNGNRGGRLRDVLFFAHAALAHAGGEVYFTFAGENQASIERTLKLLQGKMEGEGETDEVFASWRRLTFIMGIGSPVRNRSKFGGRANNMPAAPWS